MSFKTYLVGGAVRDEILGVKPKDLDFVMLAPSFEAMTNQLLREGAKIFVSTPDFLTLRCKHPKHGPADYACARKDGVYEDGRHPESVMIAETLEEDLARRDMTIGAMAKDMETGEIIDPFNGRDDCAAKVIRFVGKPAHRLAEDKLRAFRAVRFAVTKKFELARSTSDAIKTLLGGDFDGVSTERIREELFKMFSVNMLKSYDLVFRKFPNLGRVVLKRGIWFEPTTKARP